VAQHVWAVTLLRAALSAPLRDDYRARVEELLARCLAQAQKELNRAAKRGAGKQSPAVS
jgi:hypothetical protein